MNLTIIEVHQIQKFLKQHKAKPLTRKQLGLVFELIDHKMQQAQLKGFEDGKASVKVPVKEQLRVDLSISIQRLAESNAQIATSLSKAIDKL